jgi:tetratricopeptide (TPR) repeat protein
MKEKIDTIGAKSLFILSIVSLVAATWAAPLSAQKAGKKKGGKAKTGKVVKEEAGEGAKAEAGEEAKEAVGAEGTKTKAGTEVKGKAATEKAVEGTKETAGKEEEVNLDAKEEAADLFFEGVLLFDQGKHASALEKFTKSYALHHHWKTLYNIGMCYLELNDLPNAADKLAQFLDEGAGKIQKEIVEDVAASLKKIMAKVGIIRLTGYLEGGVLTIDGVENPRGAQGKEVFVLPGVHSIKLVSGKFLLIDKKITIEGGEEKEIYVLEPSTGTVIVDTGTGGEGAKVKGPSEEEIREMQKRRTLKSAGWALFGLGLACLGAGFAAGGVALAGKSDVEKLQDKYKDEFDTHDAAYLAPILKDRNDKYDAAMNASLASTVLIGVGGAAAFVSFILLPFGYKKAKVEKKPETKPQKKIEKKADLDLLIAPDSLGLNVSF